MYTYIYSSFLQKKQYSRQLMDIETDLGVYGLAGDIRRLSNFLTLESIIRDILKKRGATAVVVGDDGTFFNVFNLLVGSKVVLGFIPVNESRYGELLGVSTETACGVVAARRLTSVDLGQINNKYFFESAVTQKEIQVALACDDFLIETNKKFKICFSNIGPGNPFDDQLEVVIFNEPVFGKQEKIFASVPFQKCQLKNINPVEMILDGHKKILIPVRVKTAPKAIQVIVGKERAF